MAGSSAERGMRDPAVCSTRRTDYATFTSRNPSEIRNSLRREMSGNTDSVRVSNAELASVRDAMRELNQMIDALEQGELEKIVLTRRNQMRAVIMSLERYSELEQRTP